jgi:hypothetical protein
MLVEVALKLTEEESLAKGSTAVCRPAKGQFFTPQQVRDWVEQGTEPSPMRMRRNKKASFEQLIQRARYWLDPALDRLESAKIRWTSEPISDTIPWNSLPQTTRDLKLDGIDAIVVTYQDWTESAYTLGIHSDWGFKDLKVFGIAVMDLPYDLIEDLCKEPASTSIGPPFGKRREKKKRAYSVDFESYLSPESLARWVDQDRHVIPSSIEPDWVDTDAWGMDKLDTVTMPSIDPRVRVLR